MSRCLTLADSIRLARDGGRIVIDSNGPYETGPARITGKRLTIQAAPGSRPTLRYRHTQRDALLFSDAPLTLEGLTFEVLPASTREVLPLDVVRSERSLLRVSHCRFQAQPGEPVSGPEAERLLRRLLSWHDNGNVYAGGGDLLRHLAWSGTKVLDLSDVPPVRTLDDWARVWGRKKPNALQGVVRFQGVSNLDPARDPRLLRPLDFRLDMDSSGTGKGPGGKYVGCDVEAAGPGTSYDTWRNSPAYPPGRNRASRPNPAPTASHSRKSSRLGCRMPAELGRGKRWDPCRRLVRQVNR